MATDKTSIWSLGEPSLWYSPNTALDPIWSKGEPTILDEYIAPAGGLSIPVAIAGAWKDATPQILIAGAWHDISAAKILIDGAWKDHP
jgi:hypothetical protein